MKTSELQRYYKELTPFERANMFMQEAVGRQRESEVEALKAPTIVDKIQTTLWGDVFYVIASFAMYKAQSMFNEYLILSSTIKDENESTKIIKTL